MQSVKCKAKNCGAAVRGVFVERTAYGVYRDAYSVLRIAGVKNFVAILNRLRKM